MSRSGSRVRPSLVALIGRFSTYPTWLPRVKLVWFDHDAEWRRLAVSFLVLLSLLVLGALMRIDYVWEQIPAITAACLLFAAIALVSFSTYRNELKKVALVLFLVIWQAFSNSDPYKMRYPGLDGFYARLVRPTSSTIALDGDVPAGEKKESDLDQKLARKKREIEDLKAAATIRPRDAQAQIELGLAYFDAGILLGGEQHSQARSSSEPPKESRDDYFDKSIEAFSNAIKYSPNRGFAYAGRGAARAERRRGLVVNKSGAIAGPEQSIQDQDLSEKSIRDDYLTAKRLDPDDPSVLLACWRYFSSIYDFKSVVELDVKKLLPDRDDAPSLLNAMSFAKSTTGDLDGEIAVCEMMLRLGHKLASPGNKGWLDTARSQIKDTLVERALMSNPPDQRLLDRALKYSLNDVEEKGPGPGSVGRPADDPRNLIFRAGTRHDLGDSKGALKDLDDAKELLETAKATGDNSIQDARSDYYRYRVLVLTRLGLLEEARENLEAYHKLIREASKTPFRGDAESRPRQLAPEIEFAPDRER